MTEAEELELMEMQVQQSQFDPKFNRPVGPKTAPRLPEGVTPEQALQAAVSGVGQGLTFGFMDEIVGAAKAPYHFLSNMNEDEPLTYPEAYAKGRDDSRLRLAESKEFAPVITGVGDVGGSLLSGLPAYNALKKINMAPKTLLGSASFGGSEGAINAYGRSNDAEQTMSNLLTDIPIGATFGIGGYSLAELGKRMARGRNYEPNSIRHAQADELGIQLSPSQKYEDPTLDKIEASMRADPGYSKSFEAMDTFNQVRANQIANRTIGIRSDKLTDVEFGEAQANITKKFKQAANQGESVYMDDQWMDDLDAIEAGYTKAWGKTDASTKILEDARKASTSQYMTPEEYQFQYSRLGKGLQKAINDGDGHKIDLFRGMRTALNDVLDRSYPNQSSVTQEARDLYKAKLLLQKPGVVNTGSGDVSPLTLANKLRRDVRGYLEGGDQSDLYNLGRVSQNFKTQVGDSGTATRNKTLLDYMLTAPKNVAGDLYLSGKIGTSMTGGNAGGGALSNPVLNSLMQSPELIRALQEEDDSLMY